LRLSGTISAWLAWLGDRLVPARTERFDDLVAAVVGGFRRGRADVRKRALGTIETLVPPGGDAPAVTLGETENAVIVPLAALAKIQVPSLAELSLEFDCVVEPLRRDGREDLALRMVREGTRGAYRLKIDVSADECILVVATLDGQALQAHALAFAVEDL